MVCPDCRQAKISQLIRLEKINGRHLCPDCGGEKIKGTWYSAPKYPEKENEYLELMGIRKISNAHKRGGVWRSRDVVKI